MKNEENLDYNKYWEAVKQSYPRLYILSRVYSAFAASEISVERLFSYCSNIISSRRNRMQFDRLGKIVSLKYNLTKGNIFSEEEFFDELKKEILKEVSLK